MIEYHNPEASTATASLPYDLSLPLRDTAGVQVGLLANGFPDSVPFLESLQVSLQVLLPGVKFRLFNKRDASRPADEELLGEIEGECAALIAAYGH